MDDTISFDELTRGADTLLTDAVELAARREVEVGVVLDAMRLYLQRDTVQRARRKDVDFRSMFDELNRRFDLLAAAASAAVDSAQRAAPTMRSSYMHYLKRTEVGLSLLEDVEALGAALEEARNGTQAG